MNIDLWFEPVADGVMIDIPGLAGKEDQQIPLPVAITPKGGESPGANAYIQVCADATLSGNYATVLSSDSDATIGEEDVTGFHRVPIAEVSNLSMDTAQVCFDMETCLLFPIPLFCVLIIPCTTSIGTESATSP